MHVSKRKVQLLVNAVKKGFTGFGNRDSVE